MLAIEKLSLSEICLCFVIAMFGHECCGLYYDDDDVISRLAIELVDHKWLAITVIQRNHSKYLTEVRMAYLLTTSSTCPFTSSLGNTKALRGVCYLYTGQFIDKEATY